MNEQNQWYVTIDGNAVGPVSTDLVVRGIKHKKIATNAYVCVVGASEWQLLADVAEFHTALRESGMLEAAPPKNGYHHDDVQGQPLLAQALSVEQPQLDEAGDADDSEATASFASQRSPELVSAGAATETRVTNLDAHEAFPTIAEAIGDGHAEASEGLPTLIGNAGESRGPIITEAEPRNGKHVELAHVGRPRLPSMELDIDVTVDDSPAPDIDWNHGFAAYFLVSSDVVLPDEHELLQSLRCEAHETFHSDEAMWNLGLCLAFGTDAVAAAAASVFFDVVATHGLFERIEWMCRTLLSKGFMPSGIPHAAGYRGLSHLQQVCPATLLPKLEAEAAS